MSDDNLELRPWEQPPTTEKSDPAISDPSSDSSSQHASPKEQAGAEEQGKTAAGEEAPEGSSQGASESQGSSATGCGCGLMLVVLVVGLIVAAVLGIRSCAAQRPLDNDAQAVTVEKTEVTDIQDSSGAFWHVATSPAVVEVRRQGTRSNTSVFITFQPKNKGGRSEYNPMWFTGSVELKQENGDKVTCKGKSSSQGFVYGQPFEIPCSSTPKGKVIKVTLLTF